MDNEYHRNQTNPMLKIAFSMIDSTFVFFLLVVITEFYPDATWSLIYTILGLIGVMVFLFTSEVAAVYQSWRGISFQTECARILVAWLFAILTLLVVAYATKTTAEYSRIVVGVWFFLAPAGLCFWHGLVRLLLSKYRSTGHNRRRVAALGANENGVQMA